MFGGVFNSFNNDPFFEDAPLRMRPFDMADPFGMFGGPRAALTGPERQPGQSNYALARRNDLMWPFGRSPFDSMFGNMANDPNAHTFSSSTVMSYSSNGPDGNPQMYHASQSTRSGPGGIQETRKQVRDSTSGIQKMSVGHQIGDKSHAIGKSFNYKTNEEIDTHDFVNLDEDDTDMFEKEWDQRTQVCNNAGMMLGGSHHQRPVNHLALTSKPYHSQDYDEATASDRRERRHHHQQDHSDSVDLDQAARTRPHHTYVDTDVGARHQHELPNNLDPGPHKQHRSKPIGLGASRRRDMDQQMSYGMTNEGEMDPGYQWQHHSRPKAPATGHRSKPKNVNFTDNIAGERPVRRQPHHYSKHTQDRSRHSTKKSASTPYY